MTRQHGAVRIFFYNWPIYVGTWLPALALLLFVPFMDPPARALAAFVAVTALAWSLTSLLVSFYIYDRSALVSGRWVSPLLGPMSTWATIHAGLDAEVELDTVMHGRCVGRLDIFDPKLMSSPSIVRARRRTPQVHHASPASPTALPIESGACDAIVVAFTAHEIRDRGAREAFFVELRRSLRPGGKVLIVEHFRDLANFLAFGPGYVHFVSRDEWLRLAAHANLAVASETKITPWVTALTLARVS